MNEGDFTLDKDYVDVETTVITDPNEFLDEKDEEYDKDAKPFEETI